MIDSHCHLNFPAIKDDVTPTLYWEVPIDPDDRSRSIVSYYVYLDTNLTDLVPDTVSTNSYTASNLIEDAMYYWKIVAVDDDGGTNESSTWSFWMNGENSPPLAFSLVEPLNNAVLNIFNPPFCWEESIDPDGDEVAYTIYLSEDMYETSVIYTGPYMESCFYETMGLVEDNTTYYWKVTATDPDGAATENTGGYHSFSINTDNDQPVAMDIEVETQEDTEYNGVLEASDADGDLLTFHIYDDPEVGEVDMRDDGEFTYIPEEDYNGTDSFNFEVCDQDLCDIGTVTIYVTSVNDEPFYVSEMHAVVGLNMEFNIPLHAEDIDSEELTSSLTVSTLNPSWVFVEDNHLHGNPTELGYHTIYLSLSDDKPWAQATVIISYN